MLPILPDPQLQDHLAIAGIANGVFPAAILAMQQRHGHVTLGGCCKVLGVVLCGTLFAKLALEGWKSFPDYSVHGRRAAGVSGCCNCNFRCAEPSC